MSVPVKATGRVNTTHPRKVSRACDLCHHKRIRCDGAKPNCAACQRDKVPCHFLRPRRPRKSKKSLEAAVERLADGLTTLESLIKSLSPERYETVLQQLDRLRVQNLPPQAAVGQLDQTFDAIQNERLDSQTVTIPGQGVGEVPDYLPENQDGKSMDLNMRFLKRFLQPPKYAELPSRCLFQSLIDQFFSNFHPAFPLFPYDSVMGHGGEDDRGDQVSEVEDWARFNVILALSYHLNAVYGVEAQLNHEKAEAHVGYGLAAVEKLLPQSPSMVSIQALLGVAVVIYGTVGPGPSSILIAAALRDCFRLGLHRRTATVGPTDPKSSEQRHRVFWTAYSLHASISFELDLPMAFHDHIEINVPAPSFDADVPLLYSSDQSHTFNIYGARAQLAIIQSHIRKSVRSSGLMETSLDDQRNQVTASFLELAQWRKTQPSIFEVDHIVRMFHLPAALHIMTLHASYFHCLRFLQVAEQKNHDHHHYCNCLPATEPQPPHLQSHFSSGPPSIIMQHHIQCAREVLSLATMLWGVDLAGIHGLINSLVAAAQVLVDCSLGQRSQALLQADVRRCAPLVKLLQHAPSAFEGRDVDEVIAAYKSVQVESPRQTHFDFDEM